jgi:hypothetical protein
MAYLDAGIFILTDPRHRIAKWYARYFKDKIIFIDDNALEKLTIDFLNNQMTAKLIKNPLPYGDAYFRLSEKIRIRLANFLLN